MKKWQKLAIGAGTAIGIGYLLMKEARARGRNWFVLDKDGKKVHEYDSTWSYANVSHSLEEAYQPVGLFRGNGGNWYVVDWGKAGYAPPYLLKYSESWGFLGKSNLESKVNLDFAFSVFQEDDGTWWMLGDTKVLKFDSDWNYTGESFTLDSDIDARRLRSLFKGNDGSWWVLIDDEKNFVKKGHIAWAYEDYVYKFDQSWNYTGEKHPIFRQKYKQVRLPGGEWLDEWIPVPDPKNVLEDRPTGIWQEGGEWYVAGTATDSVHKFDGEWKYTSESFDMKGEPWSIYR